MPDDVYYGLTGVSGESFHCGVPNFSSNLFDTTIFETSNSFSYLNETNNTNTSELSFSCPIAPSSPKKKVTPGRSDLPLRVLVLNCQTIKTPGKPAQLQNIINSTQADIVIGSESWLTQDIKSAKVFHPSYKCYRNDRADGHRGGVFLLI